MQTRTCSSILGFLSLSLSLLLSRSYAETFNPNELPKTLQVEKKDGKLYTKGFYPAPQAICQPFNIQKPSSEAKTYYIQNLDKLSKAWDFSISFPGTQPIFRFKVLKDGRLADTKVLLSSGDSNKDELILSGLKKVFPLEPFLGKTDKDSSTFVLSPQIAHYHVSNPNTGTIPENSKELNILAKKWIKEITPVIKQRWHVPYIISNTACPLRSSYIFWVDTLTGNILDSYLSQSSLDTIFDQAAGSSFKGLTAIPSPLKPFPQRVIAVEYTFDLNIYPLFNNPYNSHYKH